MIDNKMLERFEKRFNEVDKATAPSVAKHGIKQASINNNLARRHNGMYSVQTKRGKITEQKSSGRCWMFAALNTARVDTIKKYNLETVEFSQNYSLFWDKFERSNYVLDSIIDTIEENRDSRVVAYILLDPLGDGGQWDMYKALLKKYGAVPKDHMPETYHSSNTTDMRVYLTSMLRFYASELRDEYAKSKNIDKLKEMKEEMLYHIYNILVKCLGEPPKEVNFEYYDKDENYHRLPAMSPVDFFKEAVGWNLDDKVSVINAPTDDKPYGKLYTVKYLGNVSESEPIKYLNLEIDELRKAAIKSLENGDPVWFGCDVGKELDRELGVMDLDAFEFERTLGYVPNWTKAKRLDYYQSQLTHAMVFTGVNLDENGKPINWMVENSWGEKSGNKGMYSMSDEWFDVYVYQIMIDKKYLEPEQAKMFEQELVELKPWDPMGALAL